MFENQSSDFIEITIEENFEDKNINKTSLEYLFQNIRQQIIIIIQKKNSTYNYQKMFNKR